MDDVRYDAPAPSEPSEWTAEQAEGVPRAQGAAAWSGWSNLWQIPTIIASGILIAFGVYIALSRAPASDFNGALAQVEQLIEAGRFDLARARLTNVIEPNLDEATPLQRARFYAAVADWLAVTQAAIATRDEHDSRLIASHYAEADSLGLSLSPARIERWAQALIALGDIPGARQRMAALDALDLGSDQSSEIRDRRNRVLRAMIEMSLLEPDRSTDEILSILRDYRRDQRLSAADELWATARAAEARLRAGQPKEAIDHLLVEMRRLEARERESAPLQFGELYILLARAHYDLGNFRDSRFNIQMGLQTLSTAHPARGDAAILLSAMLVGEDDLEAALEQYDIVVRNFVGTPSYLPGLLGRAEVLGKLGRHDRSRDDYGVLCDSLPGTDRNMKMRRDVARSLLERHDAVLTTGHLDVALSYVSLAESMFDPEDVPADVLYRLAVTNRQAGDDLLPSGPESPADPRPAAQRLAATDPAIRARAAAHYATAASNFVRHARAVRLDPGEEDSWGSSLWMAADSFDLAGLHDEAIRHFREFISGRGDEPRRAEAQFRLGLALQAVFDDEGAIGALEQLLEEHPRSLYASMSHVPLARCFMALGRQSEAEAELMAVLAGERFLEPDAVHYRDALIELSRINHNAGDYRQAIERLAEALERYPDDPRRAEIVFRLADSYRRSARTHETAIETAAALAPSERLRLAGLRTDQLNRALQLFDLVVSEHELGPQASLNPLDEELLRSSFYYRADSAFDLGLYPEAIEYYTQAARKYRDHHSSMHALIQIYNCYNELGDSDAARNAHQRALVRLTQLPDLAFDAPGALMDREAWERWLRNSPVGPVARAGAADG